MVFKDLIILFIRDIDKLKNVEKIYDFKSFQLLKGTYGRQRHCVRVSL